MKYIQPISNLNNIVARVNRCIYYFFGQNMNHNSYCSAGGNVLILVLSTDFNERLHFIGKDLLTFFRFNHYGDDFGPSK